MTERSIMVKTGATSKVALVVFNAAANQSPTTAIGSGPAKFWLKKRGWVVCMERSMIVCTASANWSGDTGCWSTSIPRPTVVANSAISSFGLA